jgi:cellulose biosynthesis protein BcsQ
LKIGIIDADDTQNSISQIRQREYEYDTEHSGDYEIMTISSSDLPNRIEYLKEVFDIILIDLPGNLKQEGVVECLYMIDISIIPFEPNPVSLDGTLLFYNIYSKIKEDREKSGFKTVVRGIANRVVIQIREYKDLIANKESLPFKLLDSHVSESKVQYQRNISTVETSQSNQSNSQGFCEEILKLITSYMEY